MQDHSDTQLLREFAERQSEPAFREIVTRHTDLVYSAALRHVESSDLACDVAQSVFIDLAGKARPLAEKMAESSSLVGWLYRSTRYAALNLLRENRRRLAHERLAMEQLITNPESASDWGIVRPLLDEAMADLSDDDREALLLRYFKSHDFRAVGRALGVSDDAAQKRVSRAVERLREFFAKRGVTVGSNGLLVAISANAVQSAPVGLSAAISTTAITSGSAGSTTLSFLKFMAATKFKLGVVSAILIAGTAVLIQQHRTNSNLRAQIAMLKASDKQTETASDLVQAPIPNSNATTSPPTPDDKSELLRLRGQVSALRRELQERPVSKPVLGWSAAFDPFDLTQFPDSTAVIHASEATNVGTATPAALLQTWLWAQRTGDIEGWLNVVEKPPDTPDAKWIEAANDIKKRQEATKESTNAEPKNTETFEEYRLSALLPIGDDYYLALFGEYDIRMGSWVGKQVFHRTNAEWRVTAYVPRK